MAQSGNCVRVKFVSGVKKRVEFLPIPLSFQQILKQVISVFGFQRFCLHFRNLNILVPLNNETDLEYIWHLFQLRKDRKQRFDILVTQLREDGSLCFGTDDSADEYYNPSLSDIHSCEFYPDYGEDSCVLDGNPGAANTGGPVGMRRQQNSLTRALSSPQSSIGSGSTASSGSVSSNNIASTAAAILGGPDSASPPSHSTSRGAGGLFIPEDDDDPYFCDTPRSGYAASVSGGSYNSLISNSSSVQNISSQNGNLTTDAAAMHSPPLADQQPHLSGHGRRHRLSVRSAASGSNNSAAALDTNTQRNQFVYESCSGVISGGNAFAGCSCSLPCTEFVLDGRENSPPSALLYSQGNENATHEEGHNQMAAASFHGGLDGDSQLHDFNSRANAVGLTVQTNCAAATDLIKNPPHHPTNNNHVSGSSVASRNTLTGGDSSVSSSAACARSHGTYPRAKADSSSPATTCPDSLQLTPVSRNTTPSNRPVVWNVSGSACSRGKMQQGLASSDMNLSQSQAAAGATSVATRSVVTCMGPPHSRMTSTPLWANNASSFFADRGTTSATFNDISHLHKSRSGAHSRRTNQGAAINDEAAVTDTSGVSSGGNNSDLSAEDVSTCSNNLKLLGEKSKYSNCSAIGSSVSDLEAKLMKKGIFEVDTAEDMKQWVPGKVIGSGGFGIVRHYYNTENGVVRAVKEIQLTERTPERTLVQAQNEIHCLTQLCHERIVKFCGTGILDYKILIFMELMSGGSVRCQIDDYGPLTESVCRKYLVQILDGLIYLHKAMIIHRDLKCANILRDANGCVKLSDFGCAKMLSDVRRHSGSVDSQSCTGSAYWMSPEVILNERYTRKADVWSLGCTVVEMVTGKAPNAHKEVLPAMYSLVAEKGCKPQFPEGASEQLKDFVTRSLTYEQLNRPSAQELRHHEYLRGVQVTRTGNSSSTK